MSCLILGGMEKENSKSGEPLTNPGTRFYQHYEILTHEDGSLWELGHGAMGVTYKAVDVNLNVPVALKVINARFSEQDSARRRFLREARAAARLRHPNVASVFHFGTLARESDQVSGDCFYAMEFIEGETLEARVQRTGPLPPSLCLELALQVTRALVAAEKRGMIHRDLKPSNIMLVAEEEAGSGAWVKVIDFGLAKAVELDAAEFEDSLTQGAFVGTPQFASPEQLQGAEVDARSDIYSLGTTLWYALTGQLPFATRNANEIRDWQANRPLPVMQLTEVATPPPLIDLIRSMLAVDPAHRPPSAAVLEESLQRYLDEVEKKRPAWKGTKVLAVGTAILIALLSSYLIWEKALAKDLDKSIAVLPWQNLSDDKDNTFLTEGIQDDLLASLARIRDLKVIGRSSVEAYRSSKPRELREIGRTLKVGHVLEGSVRRIGERALVNVHLIETGGGREIWAQHYDRAPNDVPGLQGEMTLEIASALRASLTAHEKSDIQAKSTNNADAYLLYLRGRVYQTRSAFGRSDMEMAGQFYSEAIGLDPKFTLAHARLAQTAAHLYRNFESSERNKERARQEVEIALQQRPDLGDCHLTRAIYLYYVEKDYAEALKELEIADGSLPGDLEVKFYKAAIERRQGRWRRAQESLRTILEHDPANTAALEQMSTLEAQMRDWREAARHGALFAGLSPGTPLVQLEQDYLPFWSAGNIEPLRQALAKIPPGVDPDGSVTYLRWDAAMIARDFPGGLQALDACSYETQLPAPYGPPLPKNYLRGILMLASGDTSGAFELLDSCRPAMEAETKATPNSAIRHAKLGLLYAYLGKKEDAIREGRRAVELQPVARDAYSGNVNLAYLALIYARSGELDESILLLQQLLVTPGPVFYFEANMTQSDLRKRWQWDPLRGDPRFQQLLQGPEPRTVF